MILFIARPPPLPHYAVGSMREMLCLFRPLWGPSLPEGHPVQNRWQINDWWSC